MSAYDSEVAVVNSALIKIGEQTIASLDDSSRQAVVAKRQYPLQRDWLIRRYRWNFAVRRASLAPLSETPAFGFDNQFPLPSDCLRVIGLYDEDEPQRNYTSAADPWKVEGGNILADGTELKIFYLAQVTDVSVFDPMFAEALAWKLAWDLAYFLSTGPKQAENARLGYNDAVRAAKVADAFEGTPEVVYATDWLDARSRHSQGFRPGPILDF